MGQQASRKRTLGDKLQLLATLSPADIDWVETIVDYRIEIRLQEEFDRFKAACKPYPRLADEP